MARFPAHSSEQRFLPSWKTSRRPPQRLPPVGTPSFFTKLNVVNIYQNREKSATGETLKSSESTAGVRKGREERAPPHRAAAPEGQEGCVIAESFHECGPT